MATPTDLLTLAQWFSPLFPVGAFAYSHGLEWAIEAGQVDSAETARAWIGDVLEHGAGWNDALTMVQAHRAETQEAVTEIDLTCRALAASRERLSETALQGEAFCAALAEVWALDLAGLCLPVAAGRAARLAGLPRTLSVQVYLHAFASNLASVAMRLVPLGQSDGQHVIRALTPLCVRIAETAGRADPEDWSSTVFAADLAAMKHETQYARIFRT